MSLEPGKNFWVSTGKDEPNVVRPSSETPLAAPSKTVASDATTASPWASSGSSGKAAAVAPATTFSRESRRYPRFKCEGNMELKTEGSTIRTWATFTDISITGCYVEMMTTFPVGTKLEMQLGMNGFLVNVEASVRVTYPFLGMGIEFSELPHNDREQLEAMLASLSASSLTRAYVPTKPTVNLPSISEPGAVIDALVNFFEAKSTLSLEEFLHLVETSQQRGT
jgi:hypothetical protein